MGRAGLGEFELIVMLAVLRLGEDGAHTLGIVDEIRSRTGRKVHRAAVYVTLQRLESRGLVVSWLSEPRHERGGKRRRHVKLTAAAKRAVRDARSTLESMWQDLAPARTGE